MGTLILEKSSPTHMKKHTHYPWLGTVAALCATGLSAYAGSVTYDFDTDPTGILQLFGNATYSATGGNPATGGYLSLTEAVGSQRSAIVFDDFDNGSVVKAFSFSMDVRIGGGTDTPADGFSVNYVRANDPVITSGDPLNNWATGLNGEANLPEEGSTTGLGIGFDAYDSGGGDVIGISVRVDNVLVAQYPLPTKNGAAGDTTSLQTGPIDAANPGSADLLAWEPFSVDLSETGKLVIKYKGVEITPAGGLQTTYAPSPGRLVLVARTGGSNQNQHVDNIKITTVPAALALVGNATGSADGFSVTLNDSGPSVIDTAQVTAKLNGNAVTPISVTKTGGATTVVYHGYPALLTPGATNTVDITAKDTTGNSITGSRTFTTAAYATVPASDAVPAASIDTAKTGFKLVPWQAGIQPNAIYYTEEQLAGLHGPNVADLTLATDGGYIDYTGAINFSGDGANVGIPGDTTFPGIPGPDGHTGNSSFEALTYLQFPAAGVYQMGVQSDDGFKVTSGLSAQDRFAQVLGQFNGGRGADTPTLFYVVVPAAGYYPFRLIWENGNGDAGNGLSCEWFVVNADGTKSLVGDTADANAIKAYYAGPQFAAHVSQVVPYQDQTGARPDFVTLQVTDGASTVNAGSIQLVLNGSTVAVTPTKAGAVTTVKANLSGASLLPSGSTNNALFVWADSATPAVVHSNAWSFVTMKYVTLDPSLASPAGSGDPAQRGFALKVNQLDPSTVGDTGDVTGNNIESAESQLAGLYSPAFGDNVADISTSTSGNTWNLNDAVDYLISGTSPAGNFGGDLPLPGIPGTTAITDMVAAEFKGYADLAPGFYVMGVNSDDDFRVTEATGVSRQVLHISGAGINQDIHVVNTTTNNSSYGGSLPTTPITAPLVYLTTNNCDIPDLTGKIAVVDLNRCAGDSDVVLASKMQSNGAVAVVIINVPGNGLAYVGSGTPATPVTIPVLMTSGYAGGADVLKTNANLTASIGADASLKLGEFNGNGRGTADTLFGFVVPAAGVYPLRMVYENGGGGAAVEWFSVTSDGLTADGGGKILVNDSATTGSVLLYRGVVGVSTPTVSIANGGTEVVITYTGTLEASDSVDGTYTPVAGATSPLHVPVAAAAAKFYRTRN